MMAKSSDEIFSRSHKLDRPAIEALERADIEELRSMALGDRDSPNRVRAMEALAKSDAPDATEVLSSVINDSATDTYVRAVAAIQVGRLNQPEAEEALLSLLPTVTEPVVRMKIVEALARVGSVDSVEELARVASEDAEPSIRRQAEFSRSVVAYRNGLLGYELPVPTSSAFLKVDPSNSRAVTFVRASREEIKGSLAALGDDTYGLRLSNEVGYRIECGSLRMFLGLDADLIQRGIDALTDRGAMLLGLVAQRSSLDGSFSTRLLVFARTADEDHLRLAVHRTDGKQMLFGSGQVDSSGATFELNAVGGQGSKAVFLRGVLQGPLVSITEAVSSGTIVEQRIPRRAQSAP
jgi:hypothetical protein